MQSRSPCRRSVFGFSFWFVLLGLLAVLPGCGGGGGGGTSGADTTVVGRVLDSANQDLPVANARIEIGGATTTTGADGAFTLRGATIGATAATITPPTGPAQIVAFSPPVARGSNGSFELIINIGQIRGVVLGVNGQPANGAFVTELGTGERVTTGADGSFRLDNVPAGPTSVTAVLLTASVTQAVTVGVGAGDPIQLRLVDDPNPTPPGAPRTIEGRIALSDGASPAGLVVRLLRDQTQIEQTVTAADGSYSFYVPPGTYEIRVAKDLYREAVGRVTVSDPTTPIRVDLALVR